MGVKKNIEKRKKVAELIAQKKTTAQIISELKVSPKIITEIRKGLTPEPPEKTPVQMIEGDIQSRRQAVIVRELRVKYQHLLDMYEMSEKRLETMIAIKEQPTIHDIPPVLSQSKKEAVPIIQLSDWHFEERVDPATINGLNEYNPEIATHRWNKCIQNSLKLIHGQRNISDISQLTLWLGGDFITGYIHEELEEENYMSPTQAVRFAKERIITALKFYADHGKFSKITVVCNYGNHGRTTKKPRVASSYKNSYEWMMYNDIADYFSNNKKFQFIIPNGLFAYVNVMQRMIRFWHGDTIQYSGGIGGLTIPLIKAITRYNQQIEAEYNFMGHYHQNWQATKDCIVNGSGIGFNAYAQKIGASAEKPLQGFALCDKRYGITIKTSIRCE